MALTLAGLLMLVSPFWLPWAVWLGATARCGRVPVAASRFAAAYSYDLPGDRQYDVGVWPLTVPEYYCTEQQAKDAGFHHNPLDSSVLLQRSAAIVAASAAGAKEGVTRRGAHLKVRDE